MVADALRGVRYATRFIRRSPRIFAALTLTFGLTVAATTVVLSILDVAFLRALPYRDPRALVRIAKLFPQGTPEHTHYAELLDWRARNATFEALAAVRWEDANLLHGVNPQHIKAEFVTANLFSMLGVHPLLGRLFEATDEQPGARVAILTEGTWRGAFGADPDIVGKQLRVDDFFGTASYEIVGVMPSEMCIYELPRAAVFLPQPYRLPAGALDPGPVYTVFGRLKPGVPIQVARDNLTQLIHTAPQRFDSPGGYVVSMHQAELGNNERTLMMLAVAVGLVALIACVNIASLVLTFGATRRQEFAVRSAIGASRGRLARQLLTEHGVVAVFGTALAGALTIVGVHVVLAITPADLPRIEQLSVNWRLLGLGCGLAAAISLLSGVLPWWLLSRGTFTSMKGSTATGLTRWRDALVAAQLGLVLAIAIAAALAMHSFWLLEHADLGYDPSNVVAAELLLAARWHTVSQTVTFQRELLARMQATTGNGGTALVDVLPPSASTGWVYLQDGRLVHPAFYLVSPDYFRVLRIPVLEGEPLSERANVWPVVVSRSFARLFFGQHAVGENLNPSGHVVGVVGDTWQAQQTTEAPQPTMYANLLAGRESSDRFWLLVRSASRESVVFGQIRSAVSAIDPDVPLRFTTLDTEVARARTQPRFFAVMLGGFGGFGLLLASIGVFTSVQQSVTERMRELAIRLALGSEPRAIYYLVGRRLALLSIVAVLTGAWIGLVGARGLRTVLFGLTPTDAPTVGAAAILIVFVAVIAAWGPLRRAASVDPLVLLREE